MRKNAKAQEDLKKHGLVDADDTPVADSGPRNEREVVELVQERAKEKGLHPKVVLGELLLSEEERSNGVKEILWTRLSQMVRNQISLGGGAHDERALFL